MINKCTQILDLFRYTMVHGQCLTVGVGGYLLKGGFNYLGGSARHGNGARHVVRYTMVSPKGEIMVVDKDGVTKLEKGTEVGIPTAVVHVLSTSNMSLNRWLIILLSTTTTCSTGSKLPEPASGSSPSFFTGFSKSQVGIV